ncbi:MAG: transcription elongation factor GreA [Candidatus Nomurabacteria bacterium]|jgi:transcription elongation factor GreA|nr:transcription elongation factor GreA [Candidatus Nomurabacteria bacterium]
MNSVMSITADGREELEKELEGLIAKRPEMAEKIATARAFGDLSENEEYSSARGEQKVIEGRILEIQDILKRAKIIRAGKRERVALGATVVLNSGGKEQTYTVVGVVEANPLEGKISNESPIGKEILGKKAGDSVTLSNGKVYKIVEIS